MLLDLLGWFYIVTGVVFLIQPESMRNKIKKVGMKKLRKYFFALAFIIGSLLIKATWGLEGFLAKLFFVMGVIALIKGIYYLKGRTAEKVLDWWLAKDVSFFRTTAIIQIIVGGLLLSV